MYGGLYGILILCSLPLIYEWVPPNKWVGFRFAPALANLDVWYEINRMGGRLFLIAMLFCLAVNLFLIWKAPPQVQANLPAINFALIAVSLWLVSVELLNYLT